MTESPARVGRRVPRNVYWLDEPLIVAANERRAKWIVAHLNTLARTSPLKVQGIVDMIREATNAIEYLVLSGSDYVG